MASLPEAGLRYEVGAVVVASSATAGGYVVGRSKTDKSKAGNLAGTIMDVSNFYALCVRTNAIHVNKLFSDTDPKTTTKFNVLEAITQLFAESFRRSFILYYSGHGKRGDGSWCFERPVTAFVEGVEMEVLIKEYITCEEVIALWNARPNHEDFHKLVIISDSCFSGHWCEKVDASYNTNIFVQASADSAETCSDSLKGGTFSLTYFDSCFGFQSVDASIGTTIGIFVGCTIATPFVAVKDYIALPISRSLSSSYDFTPTRSGTPPTDTLWRKLDAMTGQVSDIMRLGCTLDRKYYITVTRSSGFVWFNTHTTLGTIVKYTTAGYRGGV